MPTEQYARIACLLYLGAAVLDYQGSQAAMDIFMTILHEVIVRRTGLHTVSAEELLYALFEGLGIQDVKAMERVWMVSRLMSVAKKFPEQRWNESCEILMKFLGMVDLEVRE